PIVGEHGREASGASGTGVRRNVLQGVGYQELLVPATWPGRRDRRDRSAVVHERPGDAIDMARRARGHHLERATVDVRRDRSERVVLDGGVPDRAVTGDRKS